MNSPVHLPTKTERLELALRSGTLADVAGILAEMSPGDVAYLISSSPPDYRDLLLGLLEPDQEVLVVNELPDDLRNATLMNREPKRWRKSLSNSMKMTSRTFSTSSRMR